MGLDLTPKGPEINKVADTKSILRKLIESHGRSFGSTESGRAWCIKALHPSDPSGEILGLPDQSARSVVFHNYPQTITVTHATGGTGAWEVVILFKADPTCPVSCYGTDSDGTHPFTQDVPNTVWGANVNDATLAFTDAVEAWRVAYAGVTVNLDAPVMTNQGNVVAAQYVPMPVDLGPCTYGTHPTVNHVVKYQVADAPVYEMVMQMPSAYTGLAKDGVYMPLKLDSNHQKWWTASDGMVFDASGAAWTLDVNGNSWIPPTLTAGTCGVGLYPATNELWWEAAGAPDGWEGGVHLLPCSQQVGCIAFKNLHQDSALRITYRLGVECCVQPGTPLTPSQHISPEYDREAIESYYAIARRLNDAYPASYNDMGKLWEVIKQIATFIGPAVRVLPYGEPVTQLASAVGKAIDKSVKARKKKGGTRPQPKRGTPK